MWLVYHFGAVESWLWLHWHIIISMHEEYYRWTWQYCWWWHCCWWVSLCWPWGSDKGYSYQCFRHCGEAINPLLVVFFANVVIRKADSSFCSGLSSLTIESYRRRKHLYKFYQTTNGIHWKLIDASCIPLSYGCGMMIKPCFYMIRSSRHPEGS